MEGPAKTAEDFIPMERVISINGGRNMLSNSDSGTITLRRKAAKRSEPWYNNLASPPTKKPRLDDATMATATAEAGTKTASPDVAMVFPPAADVRDDANNDSVTDIQSKSRTNVTQAPPPPKPWCEQPGNTAHLIEAARYSPFFDGMDEAHNKLYMRIVRKSVKTSGGGSPDKTIVKWSSEMKVAALKVTNKLLTRIQSSFRAQYRSKLLKSSCTVPSFFLGTDTACF
jgi:hypothetical protein